MKFQPGHAKLGGRKRGVRNKRRSIYEACEELGLDPFAELAKIAMAEDHPDRFLALKELCQYIEPKKKAVEVAAENREQILVEIRDYSAARGTENNKYLAASSD